MKMNTKKLIVFAMVLMFALLLLTSCGGGESGSSNNPGGNNSGSDSSGNNGSGSGSGSDNDSGNGSGNSGGNDSGNSGGNSGGNDGGNSSGNSGGSSSSSGNSSSSSSSDSNSDDESSVYGNNDGTATLASDGGGGSNGGSSTATQSGGESSTATPSGGFRTLIDPSWSQTDPGKYECNQVIWDDDGMKITMTGFEYGSVTESYSITKPSNFYFTIENRRDMDILASFKRMSINGCMLDFAFLSSGGTNRTAPGETRDDTYLRFSPNYLDEAGITEIRDFEFNIDFNDPNERYKTLFLSGPIAMMGPDHSGVEQQFAADGVIILDEQGVKITVVGLEYEIRSGMSHGILLFIENYSGSDILVAESYSYINGGEGPDGLLNYVVADAKVAFEYISYDSDIETIEDVGLSISVHALDKYDDDYFVTLIDGDELEPVIVAFDASGKATIR